MNKIHTHIFSIFLSGVAALFTVFFAAVYAEGGTPEEMVEEGELKGITFPIPELGNCGSKEECKSYCNEGPNMSACIAFAKKHGLMTEEEAKTAEKFAGRVTSGKGPGGCNSPESCKAYCSDMTHLEECISFAEKHGITDEHYKHGKKILAHLKAGGKTPGECNSKESCERYCGDFSHAKECFEFAEKAGILEDLQEEMGHGGNGPDGKMPTKEQMQKMMELAAKGETPGRCTGKESCEAYCSEAGHFEECMEFGVKAGFMSREAAERMRKTGGKGPGGCNSQSSCEAFCNDPSHQEECFAFAEEHGLMSEEEASHAKEGWVRARAGFSDAPPEVRACIETAIGPQVIGGIQSGNFTPGPEVAGKVRACFEKFGGSAAPRDMFRDAPPEILSCLKEKVPDFDAIQRGEKMPTPQIADSFRACFESMHMKQGENSMALPPQDGQMPPGGMMHDGFPPNIPSGIQACLKEKFGAEFEKIVQGGQPAPEMEMKMRECWENLRQGPSGGVQIPSQPQPSGFNMPQGMGIPPEVVPCLKEMLGEEGFQRLQSAPPGPEIYEKVRLCYEKMAQGQMQQQYQQYPNQPSQYPTDPNHYQQPTSGDGMQPTPDPTYQPPPSSQPTSFLKRLLSAAGAPFRWLFGK